MSIVILNFLLKNWFKTIQLWLCLRRKNTLIFFFISIVKVRGENNCQHKFSYVTYLCKHAVVNKVTKRFLYMWIMLEVTFTICRQILFISLWCIWLKHMEMYRRRKAIHNIHLIKNTVYTNYGKTNNKQLCIHTNLHCINMK